jgi:RES domain-containing protein
MQLWRLTGAPFANRFDGGYGLEHAGRWNARGRPVTYCATGPALCVLEKLVHVEDIGLLPDDTMLIRYYAPDDLPVEESRLDELPENWRNDQALTRRLGSAWLDRAASCLLRVPSVIVPVPESDDRNIIINHRHRDAARIMISRIERFAYDPRLLNRDAPGGSRD